MKDEQSVLDTVSTLWKTCTTLEIRFFLLGVMTGLDYHDPIYRDIEFLYLVAKEKKDAF